MKTTREEKKPEEKPIVFVATFGIRLGRKEMFLSRSYVFLLFCVPPEMKLIMTLHASASAFSYFFFY